MKRASFLYLAFLLFPFAAVACGGSDSPAPGGPSAPGPGGEQPGKDTSAHSAIDGSVKRVEFARAWLGAASTPGKCDAHQEGATYDRTTHEATWHICEGGSFSDSSRVLSSDQAASVEASLAGITYVEDPPCAGYDGLNTVMTIFHADGSSRTFAVENLNCYGYAAAPKLDDTFSLLVSLK